MENAYVIEGKFIDGKTIRLTEDYPFTSQGIRLIILPEKKRIVRRKAGLLKGKIRMAENFDEPLDEMREYME